MLLLAALGTAKALAVLIAAAVALLLTGWLVVKSAKFAVVAKV